MNLHPLASDDAEGVSYLGWYQAITLADLGRNELAIQRAQATLLADTRLSDDVDNWEIGRRQHALIHRFIKQYLPYLRNQSTIGQIAQVLQGRR